MRPLSQVFPAVTLGERSWWSLSEDFLQERVFSRFLLRNGREVPDAMGCRTLRLWLSFILQMRNGLCRGVSCSNLHCELLHLSHITGGL